MNTSENTEAAAPSSPLQSVKYEVRFYGVPHKEIQKTLESVSILSSTKDKPPGTLTALHRRAEGDIPTIINVLRSFSYYDATAVVEIDSVGDIYYVNIRIDPGPIYHLSSYKIIPYSEDGMPQPEWEEGLAQISMETLHLNIGSAALASDVLHAKDHLLNFLNAQGFPLASIVKQEAIADQEAKDISVTLFVDMGPRARFGEVKVVGLKNIEEDFVLAKIKWCEEDFFNTCDIAETEKALLASELFSYVRINWDFEVDASNRIGMIIEVKEARFRSYGIGTSYTTQLGPGLEFEWENRNINNKGRRLSLRTELWTPRQKATLAYRIPHFRHVDQDLVWAGEFQNEKLKSYGDSSISGSGIIERKITEHSKFYYGGLVKLLKSTRSDNLHGNFTLLETPLQYAWSNVNNPLNPTKGQSLHMKMTPTTQVLHKSFFYLPSLLTLIFYQSRADNDDFVLATKLVAGTILGASRQTIPAPERFYSGSENTLRGYKYQTVCPIDNDNNPIGGRSQLIMSIETRTKVTDKVGIVLFYEAGNVFAESWPQIKNGLLQSIGIGGRYFTPLGPIRLDVAFPLNRRHHIDPNYQLYFSIGQAF